MELAEIRPFEPQMAEIDLFTMPDAVGVGEPSVRKVKPYISGHVTDGSSTFTFTVNGNVSVTVPVDANGNWKWVVDRKVTSLNSAFKNKENVDRVIVNKIGEVDLYDCFTMSSAPPNNSKLKQIVLINVLCTRGYAAFGNLGNLEEVVGVELSDTCNDFSYAFSRDAKIKVISIKGNGEGLTKLSGAFRACGNLATLNFPTINANCSVDNIVLYDNNLENVTVRSIKTSVSFSDCSKLTEQSVVNIFNAVAADNITLTFHATVYAMIEQQLEIEGSPIYEAYWNSDYDFNYASA